MSRIGIVGFGFVGQAVYGSLKYKSGVLISDPKKGYKDDILESEHLFVCIGTPENDFSSLIDFLNFLEFSKYEGIAIVKSTVIPEHLEGFKNLKIVSNPEFLNQNSSQEDFLNQKYCVLGGERNLTESVKNLYEDEFLTNIEKYEFCTIEESMNFKYTRNIYGAYKILFWNFIEETVGNSRKMKMMLDNIPQGDMSVVGLDGELGYGGACFPKDVNSFNSYYDHRLTRFMKNYNESLKC